MFGRATILVTLSGILIRCGLFSATAAAQVPEGDLIDYSQVKTLHWAGPGSPDTYADYQSAYSPVPFAAIPVPTPPRDYAAPPATTGQTVLVLANSNLYSSISNKIDRYCTDVRSAGYTVSLFAVSPGTPEALKAFIIANSNNVIGCVLIGNLPTAWFEVTNDYNQYGYASFPCDLFLMDLNGTWTDSNTNSIYDIHTNSTAPEIFVGRIDAHLATYGTETNLMNTYFDRLHSYYAGQIAGTYSALTYTEDDWATIGYFSTDITNAYSSRTTVKAPSTSMTNYRDVQLPSAAYDFVQLSCHSSATLHSFTRGGYLYASAVRGVPPKAIAYNLFCCSGCRYTTADCLGNCYIFNGSSRTIAVIGSTKTGSMLVFNNFYSPIGRGKSMGVAFQEWFASLAPYSSSEVYWHYGMIILGDPMLTPGSIPGTSNIPTFSDWALIIFGGCLLLLAAGRLRHA